MSLAALVGCTPDISSRLPYPPASNSIASETREEPPVSTTMPSALLAGPLSVPRTCDRKPTKPSAAPTNRIASVATMVTRNHPRGAGASGLWSACECIGLKSNAFSGEVESVEGARFLHSQTAPSINFIERGEQRASGGSRGDRRDHHRLRRQGEIAGGPQRKCPEQCAELVSDRRAGKPAGDRFGKSEQQHRRDAADDAALQAETQ